MYGLRIHSVDDKPNLCVISPGRVFIKGSDIVKCEISTYNTPKIDPSYVCFIIHTIATMNLFWSVFVLYILPLVIYTMGKNEYAENANEHLISQRSLMRESKEHNYGSTHLLGSM